MLHALVTRTVLSPVQRQLEKWWLRHAIATTVEGFTVLVDEETTDGERLGLRIAEALQLIRLYDPRRFARMRADVQRVVCSLARTVSGAHFPGSNTIYLSGGFIAQTSAEIVAVVIVHEATHARMDKMGIRLFPDFKPRIERRCVKEEIAFASTLPLDRHPHMMLWIPWRRTARELSL